MRSPARLRSAACRSLSASLRRFLGDPSPNQANSSCVEPMEEYESVLGMALASHFSGLFTTESWSVPIHNPMWNQHEPTTKGTSFATQGKDAFEQPGMLGSPFGCKMNDSTSKFIRSFMLQDVRDSSKDPFTREDSWSLYKGNRPVGASQAPNQNQSPFQVVGCLLDFEHAASLAPVEMHRHARSARCLELAAVDKSCYKRECGCIVLRFGAPKKGLEPFFPWFEEMILSWEPPQKWLVELFIPNSRVPTRKSCSDGIPRWFPFRPTPPAPEPLEPGAGQRPRSLELLGKQGTLKTTTSPCSRFFRLKARHVP